MAKPTPKCGGKYGKSTRPSRSRKRRFHGNQNTKNVEEEVVVEPVEPVVEPVVIDPVIDLVIEEPQPMVTVTENDVPVSASAKKIKPVEVPVIDSAAVVPPCNIIIDTGSLLNLFKVMDVKCPDCSCKVNVSHDLSLKCGLAHFFIAECVCECTKLCEWRHEQSTSPKVTPPKKEPGQKCFDINIRSVLAFREIGRGYSSIKDFCKFMNMPPPMDKKSYRKSFTRLYRAYTKASRNSLSNAASQAVGTRDENGVADVMASFDGTWQRRGYSSLNGVVVAISSGKVVDYEVLAKVCMQCRYWSKKKKGDEYNEWKLHHKCTINHKGSAGSMEVEGVKRMYQRSVIERNLRYTIYLGDGDSKAFDTVKELAVYPERPGAPEKAECVGHVQKRVGTRLRTYTQNYKGKFLSDKKKLNGAGRLTNKVMNTLQNYYGMVIRSNSNNLYSMKKGIAAILHHCSKHLDGGDEKKPQPEKRHQYCPRGADSWCKWQKDRATGLTTYKEKISIPEAVRDVIKPIFSHSDLAADDLLKKCLHGETQNVNEAFNQIVWRKAPKDTFVTRRTVEVATASAALHFNDGSRGILSVYEELGVVPGHFTVVASAASNTARVKQMNRKSSDKCKKARKKARAITKGFMDKDDEETPSYVTGGF